MKELITILTLSSLLAVTLQSRKEGNEGKNVLVNLDDNAEISNIKACQTGNLISCKVALIDFEAFNNDQITLPGECMGMREKMSNKGEIYSATYVNNDGCTAYLTSRNSKLLGRIFPSSGKVLEIEPCSAFQGCHVLKELDPSSEFFSGTMDISEENRRNLSPDQEALRQQGIDDNTTIVNISMKWYYTIEFAAETEDIELFFEYMILTINEAFINSEVPMRVKTQCIELSTLTEGQNYLNGGDFLDKFMASKGSIENLRGGADMASLLITNFPNDPFLGGVAIGNGWRHEGKTVSIIRKNTIWSFVHSHEIGHGFGCNHDRDFASPHDYGYELGYHINGTNKRTIMAYGKSDRNTYRINHFSNPNVFYTENGTSYATGTEAENNARVLKENRFGVAALGDEAVQCPDTTTTETPITTEAPVTPTNPPVTTEAPVTPTNPPVTTEAPVTPTNPPVSTEAPVTPTNPPVTTEAPVTPTNPPVSTEAPVTPTNPPVTTEAPVTPTNPPVTTEAPVTPTNPTVTTEAPVTPTNPPVTTTETTESPGLKTKCRVAGYAYQGDMINNKKAKNAGQCARRCMKKKNCNAWKYVLDKDSAPKKQRKKCTLLRNVRRIDEAEPFIVSGDPSKCKKITLV